jgi:uncharacterized protein YukE
VEIEWLDSLESRVREAAERLRDLRQENASLRDRIEDLETRLAAAPQTDSGPLREENEELRTRVRDLEAQLAAAESLNGEAAERWDTEREEIRRRVEGLTRRLEELAEIAP